ncbi:MAG: hypothetical protein V1804_00555 [Patescibacteria group bacterium]
MTRKSINRIYLTGAVFLAVFLLSGCSDYPEETTPSNYNSSSVYVPEKTTEEIPSARYAAPIESNDSSDDYEPQTFNGYECTDDCSGHEAGYEWAEEKGITDPNDCGGNSNSFIEGCESYAEEQ